MDSQSAIRSPLAPFSLDIGANGENSIPIWPFCRWNHCTKCSVSTTISIETLVIHVRWEFIVALCHYDYCNSTLMHTYIKRYSNNRLFGVISAIFRCRAPKFSSMVAAYDAKIFWLEYGGQFTFEVGTVQRPRNLQSRPASARQV